MNIERHGPGEFFSHIVVHNDVVYLSGHVAPGDSVEEQMTKVLSQIDERLDRVGSDRSKLLSATSGSLI